MGRQWHYNWKNLEGLAEVTPIIWNKSLANKFSYWMSEDHALTSGNKSKMILVVYSIAMDSSKVHYTSVYCSILDTLYHTSTKPKFSMGSILSLSTPNQPSYWMYLHCLSMGSTMGFDTKIVNLGFKTRSYIWNAGAWRISFTLI